MSHPRYVAKRVAEVALELGGAGALLRRRMGGRGLILAYHNIVPDDEVRGEFSGHLGASAFEAQMRALARHADVVPITELVVPAGPRRRPRVAVTIHDGYQGAFRHAVPVLVALGLPATFFVCPGLLGGEAFWWDTPNLAVWKRRADVLERLQGRGPRVREWIAGQGLAQNDRRPDFLPATEEEVLDFAAHPGIAIGSHTVSHPNLAQLDEAEVRQELVESRDRLAARFPSFVPWIAYPFGLANPTVERVAAEEGYEGGFVLDGGWIRPGTRITALTRLNIAAGLSIRGFRLRLAGLFAR